MSGTPRTLSEHESKLLLRDFGIPLAREALAVTPDEAAAAAEPLGFPVVLKLCGDAIAHKTERGLVRLGLGGRGRGARGGGGAARGGAARGRRGVAAGGGARRAASAS